MLATAGRRIIPSILHFQAAWIKRQLTGKATANMHGIVDKATH